MNSTYLRILIVFLIFLGATACGTEPEEALPFDDGEIPIFVSEIQVHSIDLPLALGESRHLEVDFFGQNQERLEPSRLHHELVISSSDPTIISVDESGQIVGEGEGTATIEIQFRDFQDHLHLEVRSQRWRKVAAGGMTTCALDWVGYVYCWGLNTHSLVRPIDPSTWADEVDPIRREGLSEIVDLAISYAHACAVNQAGHVYCWGDNSYSQVGVPGIDLIDRPYRVSALEEIRKIALAPHHSCALSAAGKLYCWGSNAQGTVAPSAGEHTAHPIEIAINAPIKDFDVGLSNTCALTEDGDVYCWGSNQYAALSVELSTRVVSVPHLIELPEPARDLAIGAASACAVLLSGALHCWGSNSYGLLGLPSETSFNSPSAVPELPPVREIHKARLNACAITVEQDLFCWGHNNHGQLGRGDKTLFELPGKVEGGQKWRQVSSSLDTVCALDEAGEIWCWGSNGFSQVGDRRELHRNSLQPVDGDQRFSRLVSYYRSTCGQLREQSDWYCWGRNGESQLQSTDLGSVNVPTLLSPFVPSEMTLGYSGGCGISADADHAGQLYCWGENSYSHLGFDSSSRGTFEPAPIDSEQRFRHISMGFVHTCGISVSGEAWCWGDNYRGEVGMNPNLSARTPRRVDSRNDYVSVSSGSIHSCALTQDGEIRCWGYNEFGELGRVTSQYWGEAEGIDSQATYVQVLAGTHLTCALTTDGKVHCWGNRELFGGPRGSATWGAPLILSGEWEKIALYDETICAIADGNLSCAGSNPLGLIDPNRGSTLADFRQIPLDFDVEEVAMGFRRLCVLDQDGKAYCMGSDHYGDLGNGPPVAHLEPFHAHPSRLN